MTTTSRMSAGLAFDPEKDLAMFTEMAGRGKQLAGIARHGHGWRFVDGAPEDAVFDLVHERSPDDDHLEYFRAAGWSHVLTVGDVHIFKAAPGTPPVHTSTETRREELLGQRDRFVVLSLVALAVFVGAVVGLASVDWNTWLEMGLLILTIIPVVYTVVPLAGYWRRSRKRSGRP